MTPRGTSIGQRASAVLEDLRELHRAEPAEAEAIRCAITAELVAMTARQSLTEKTGVEG